jgi:hypothetical protein
MSYDHDTDMTQGKRDYDHPDIVQELKRWAELDAGDPVLWAKRRVDSRQYDRKTPTNERR